MPCTSISTVPQSQHVIVEKESEIERERQRVEDSTRQVEQQLLECGHPCAAGASRYIE